jgi:hypothetical protein
MMLPRRLRQRFQTRYIVVVSRTKSRDGFNLPNGRVVLTHAFQDIAPLSRLFFLLPKAMTAVSVTLY